MTTDGMTAEKTTALRKPFPRESIGQLPKGGQLLDYVGHAAVTDRLLTVDPGWSWEPFAVTPEGLPALDRSGNLWIRLTVCGVTRIGVGDGKSAKECIGDAIRNAAMRFGVALDLWAKENLVESAQAVNTHARQTSGPDGAPGDGTPVSEPTTSGPESAPESGVLLNTSSKLAKAMYAGINEGGIPEAERIDWIGQVIGRPITSTKEMLESEAREVLRVLDERKAS